MTRVLFIRDHSITPRSFFSFLITLESREIINSGYRGINGDILAMGNPDIAVGLVVDEQIEREASSSASLLNR